MNIDESIIKKILWESLPDLEEWKINRMVEEMKKVQGFLSGKEESIYIWDD